MLRMDVPPARFQAVVHGLLPAEAVALQAIDDAGLELRAPPGI
jgi:hypothetical protein